MSVQTKPATRAPIASRGPSARPSFAAVAVGLALDGRGWKSIAVQLPGGAGHGQSYRAQADPGSPWRETSRLLHLIRRARERGWGRVCLIAASSAALGVVDALQHVGGDVAAVLWSPGLNPSIFGTADAKPRNPPTHSPSAARTLLVHGTQDEISPYDDAQAYVRADPNHRKLVSLEGQGHIFHDARTWTTASQAIFDFLGA